MHNPRKDRDPAMATPRHVSPDGFVPIVTPSTVTPYPAASPNLEDERQRKARARAADAGVATPRPRARPGLTVAAVRDALHILTRVPQRAYLHRWRGATSVLAVRDTLRALNRVVPRAYLRRWRAATHRRRPATPPAATRARGAAVLAHAARRHEARATAARWRRWAQLPARRREPPVRVGPGWPTGAKDVYAAASARAGAAALADVASKRRVGALQRAVRAWRRAVARAADVGAGLRRLATLRARRRRARRALLFRRWARCVALDRAAGERRRAAVEVEDARRAVARAATDAEHAREHAEAAGAQAAADKLRRSHDVARRARRDAARALDAMAQCEARAKRGLDLAIGRLTQAAATEQTLQRAIGASLKRHAQLDDRERAVRALEEGVQATKRRAASIKRTGKKADAARRAAADDVRRRERTLAVERARVRRRARDAEERRAAARAASRSLQNREARLVRWETSLLAAEQANVLASEAAATRDAHARAAARHHLRRAKLVARRTATAPAPEPAPWRPWRQSAPEAPARCVPAPRTPPLAAARARAGVPRAERRATPTPRRKAVKKKLVVRVPVAAASPGGGLVHVPAPIPTPVVRVEPPSPVAPTRVEPPPTPASPGAAAAEVTARWQARGEAEKNSPRRAAEASPAATAATAPVPPPVDEEVPSPPPVAEKPPPDVVAVPEKAPPPPPPNKASLSLMATRYIASETAYWAVRMQAIQRGRRPRFEFMELQSFMRGFEKPSASLQAEMTPPPSPFVAAIARRRATVEAKVNEASPPPSAAKALPPDPTPSPRAEAPPPPPQTTPPRAVTSSTSAQQTPPRAEPRNTATQTLSARPPRSPQTPPRGAGSPWARRREAHNESARARALAEAKRTPPRSPPAAATQTTPARTPPRAAEAPAPLTANEVEALRRTLAVTNEEIPRSSRAASTAPSSPGRTALVAAIDRELRLQRRGLEEVAAGVRSLVKTSRRQPDGRREAPPMASCETRRATVARREADLVQALETATDGEKARRLTRDLHACRLHLRSLEFEIAARERLY